MPTKRFNKRLLFTIFMTMVGTGTLFPMQNSMSLTADDAPQHGTKRKDTPAAQSDDGTQAQPAKKAKVDNAEQKTAVQGEVKLTEQDKLLFATAQGQTLSVEELKAKVAAGWDIDKRDERGDTPLVVALNAGNEELAKNLIKAGADVELAGAGKVTPLMLAASNGSYEMLELILYTAHENAQSYDKEGISGINTDTDEYHEEEKTSKSILAHFVNERDKGGCTALMYAARTGNKRMVKTLLCSGASTHIRNKHKKTASELIASSYTELATFIDEWEQQQKNIKDAVSSENVKQVAALLTAGAHPFYIEGLTLKPLVILAIKKTKNIELVKLLVDANDNESILPFINILRWRSLTNSKTLFSYVQIQDVDDDDDDDADAENNDNAWRKQVAEHLTTYKPVQDTEELVIAASHGDIEKMQALIKAGADLDGIDIEGDSALTEAAHRGHEEAVLFLLQAGANPNILDWSGNTALTYAARENFPAIAQLLLGFRADPNKGSRYYGTALIHAVWHQQYALVRELLAAGADVNILSLMEGNCEQTPLMVAAEKGSLEIVQLLLKYKADINAQIYRGHPTALTYAVTNNHVEIALQLIKAGAGTQLKKSGESALEETAALGHVACVKLLLDHGARVDDTGDTTALQQAAKHGHYDVVQLLLDRGAAIDRVTYRAGRYNTALSLAIENKHAAVAQLLIERKASIADATALYQFQQESKKQAAEEKKS